MKTMTGRIQQLLGEVTAVFGAQDEDERQWMADRCSPELAPVVSELSVQSLHLLDAVAAAGSINVIGLARSTGVPKGTVSKALQRLVTAGLVQRGRLPGNRKEVHVSLTEAGRQVQRAHTSLHAQMGDGVTAFLQRYTDDELAVIVKVLTDLTRVPRVGLQLRPDLLDAPE